MHAGKYVAKWLIRSFGILFIIATLTVGSFFALRAFGKSELYKEKEDVVPTPPEEVVEVQISEQYDPDVIPYQGELYRYNKDILTFLIMGVDSLNPLPDPNEIEDYTQGGQADTLFLVVVNPHIEEVQIIAINRNSMTEIDVYDEDNNYVRTDLLQVCLQHGYGSGLEDSCERQVQAVSKLFYDLPIHGYISMNMAAVPILNDSVGGVKLEVMEDIPWGTDVIAHGKGNVVTLEGMDAYYYLQFRDVNIFDSATMRLARQKQYLNAFAHQAIAETKKDIRFPLSMINALSDYMVTDIDSAKITYLASTYLGYSFNMDGIYNLKGETITGGGGFEEFVVDDDALFDLIISLFYERIEE